MNLGPDDIVRAFKDCGIRQGETLMLHSDAIALAQLPPMPVTQRFDTLFAALEETLGATGTVVLPTFTYSFTQGEPFDRSSTPSTVGAITEHFRKMPGVVRSGDPIFSVAARGRLAGAFGNAEIDDCFGPASAFALLDRHDGWIACLGCGFDRITFTHYVEQQNRVDYRYFKTFNGSISEGGLCRPAAVRYFVRDLQRATEIDLGILHARLSERGLLASTALGRVRLTAVRCRDFAEQARQLLAENPSALIREGASLSLP